VRRAGTLLAAALLGLSWPAAGALASPASENPQQNYILLCQGCHGPDGHGVAGRVPPLADTVGPLMHSAAGREFLMRVPGSANSALSDQQLAGVLNWLVARYAATSLPPEARPFTAADVSAARHRPLTSVTATRRAVTAELAAAGIVLANAY
jgi:mono/diheme cytochrome c family protein